MGRGLALTLDQPANVLRCVEVGRAPWANVPFFEQHCRLATFASGVGLPGRIWATQSPAWIPDVILDANFPRAPIAVREKLHAAVGFPIRNGVEFLGVMEFFSREIRQPDNELLQMMSSIGSHISQFIERRHAEKALHEREREFSLARTIQQALLPKAALCVGGFEIGGGSHPTQETGGDYFDFFALPDESIGIAIGDVSGHGIGAALLMAETRAYLRAVAVDHTDLGYILQRVNRHLAEDFSVDTFVTLLLARLDLRSSSIIYASAGHPTGYVLDDAGEVKRTLPSTSLPLGIDTHAGFPVAEKITLAPGNLILLLTDGVVDAAPSHGKPFGIDRALSLVRDHRRESPQAIVQALFHSVRCFCQNPLADDITAVVIKVPSKDER